MSTKRLVSLGMLSVSVAALACVATMERALAQPAAAGRQAGSNQPAVGAGDIAGLVTGPQGPEAGVWVTAETRDLPTKYVKIVATDDMGRYLIPDLPRATYDI
jgi:hypothetical protein